MTQSELFKNKAKEIPLSKSLLKSAMQKSIRRGEVNKAVRCTKSLMDKDTKACLRRLMVVALEDGLLIPGYAELAIMTEKIRKKQDKLSEEEKTRVLTMVADLAGCEWRDFHKANPDYSDTYSLAALGDDERCLINAITYRAKIGGYKDDIDMLRTYSKIWSNRFSKDWNFNRLKDYFTGEVIDYRDIPYAQVSDIPLEAPDFHISPVGKILLKKPYVSQLIRDAFPDGTRQWAEPWTSDEDILNKIAWAFRSGVNYKKVLWTGKPVDWLVADNIPKHHWDDFKAIYRRIQPELDSIANWYLSKETK